VPSVVSGDLEKIVDLNGEGRFGTRVQIISPAGPIDACRVLPCLSGLYSERTRENGNTNGQT
jgi:hypothetical protein